MFLSETIKMCNNDVAENSCISQTFCLVDIKNQNPKTSVVTSLAVAKTDMQSCCVLITRDPWLSKKLSLDDLIHMCTCYVFSANKKGRLLVSLLIDYSVVNEPFDPGQGAFKA